MTALIQALSRLSTTASNVNTTLLTVFCLAGLVVSLLCANNGIDLTPAFVGP